MIGGLRRAAQVGWTAAGRVATRLASFVFLILIAREIGAAQIGAVSTALVLYLLYDVVVLNGIRRRIVQAEAPSVEDLRLFSLIGFAGAAVLGLGAAIVAAALEDGGEGPSAATLVAVFMGIAAARGAESPHHGLMLRDGGYVGIARIMTLGALAGGLCGYLAALLGAGVWSIVVLHAVGAGVSAALFQRGSGAVGVRPGWSARAFAEHRGFLSAFFGAEGMQGVGRQLDLLIMPLLVGLETAGHYFIARRAIETVAQFTVAAVADPAFAAFVAARGDGPALAEARGFYLALMMAVVAPLFLGVALVGGDLFAVAMGPPWRVAGELVEPLALLGLLRALQRYFGTFLVALDRRRLILRQAAASLIASALLLPPAAALGGAEGAILAMAAISVVLLVYQLREAHAVAPFELRDEGLGLARVLAPAAVMVGGVSAARAASAQAGVGAASAGGVAIAVAAGALVYGVGLAVANRRLVARAVAAMRQTRRRSRDVDDMDR